MSRRQTWRWRGLVAGAVVAPILCSAALAVSQRPEIQPGAVSLLSSGNLAILDARRGVFVLSTRSGEVRPLVPDFGLFEATDMAVAASGGVDQVFVTMSLRPSDSTRNPPRRGSHVTRLVRYDASGRLTRMWNLPQAIGWLAGIVVLPGKSAYVTNARSPEIYRLDLGREASGLSLWKEIRDAVTFGPMVHDTKRGRLLVADPFIGRIYGRSTGGGRTELVLDNLGEVTALALDTARDRLFIADSAGRRILVAGLAEKRPTARVFSKIEELDEPLGVAVASDGSLWVCDKTAGAIFHLSPEGALTRTLRLRR